MFFFGSTTQFRPGEIYNQVSTPDRCYDVTNVFFAHSFLGYLSRCSGWLYGMSNTKRDIWYHSLNGIERSINMVVYLMWVIREIENWLAVPPRQLLPYTAALRNRKGKGVRLIRTTPRRTAEIHNPLNTVSHTHSHDWAVSNLLPQEKENKNRSTVKHFPRCLSLSISQSFPACSRWSGLSHRSLQRDWGSLGNEDTHSISMLRSSSRAVKMPMS